MGPLPGKGENAMKKSVKLYNVLLPIWILYFFPQV